MRSYAYDYIFKNDSEYKGLLMTCSTVSTIQITNSDVVGEDFTIQDILNEEEDLIFGSCIASKIEFGTTYATDLSDVVLDVAGYPPTHSSTMFEFGTYKIERDEFVENEGVKKVKRVLGYDLLYDVLNTNYIDWYNALFPSSSTEYTLKQFRDSFFTYVGITQATITLPNDSMTVRKTVSGTELKGSTILRAICACNGCFGRMVGREFKYIFLVPIAQNLSNAYEIALNGHYIEEKHAKYTVNPIDKLIIRDSDSELIAEYPAGSANNPYVMSNNFLLYDKSANELSIIAEFIYNQIQGISYTPLEIEVKGNPCFEVGDPVYFTTVGGELVKSYILQREYKGFQSPHDIYMADGLQTRRFTADSTDMTLYKLRNLTNELARDLEHTESVLKDEVLDPDNPLSLQSQIYQSASVISAKVDKINGTSGDSFSWEMTANKFDIKNSATSVLKVTSSGAEINGKVSATSGFIGENTTNGFSIDSNNIHNGVTGMSDTTHNGIYLGKDGINLGKGNFTVTNAGALTAKSGYIGSSSGFAIGSTDIHNGMTSLSDTSHNGVYVGTDGIALGKGAFKVAKNGSGNIGDWQFSTGLLKIMNGSTQVASIYGSTAQDGTLEFNSAIMSHYARHLYFEAGSPQGASTEGIIRFDTIAGAHRFVVNTTHIELNGEIQLNNRGEITCASAGNQNLQIFASNEGDYGVKLGVYESPLSWAFCPVKDGKLRLGSPNFKWTTIYAQNGTINTSDRNAKKNIKSLRNSIKEFIMKLNPVSYVFKDGKRTHYGLIAQDVEDTMIELGMTDMDFGGLCKDKKENGEYTYGLRYEEFIAPLIKMVQLLYKEIVEIKNELKEIKELLKGDLK